MKRARLENGQREITDYLSERRHRTNLLLRFLDSARGIDALHGHSVEKTFSTEESRRAFLLNLSPEEYTQLLTGINGILRGDHKTLWDMDGEGVKMGEYDIFPEAEDKLPLLHQSLEAAQTLAHNGEPMPTIATFLGLCIVAIHAFGDGNGRTSRVARIMLEYDYSPQNKKRLETVLSDSYSMLTNAAVAEPFIHDVLQNEVGFGPIDDEYRRFVQADGMSLIMDSEYDALSFSDSVSPEHKEQFIETLKASTLYLECALFESIREEQERYSTPEHNIRLDMITRELTDEKIDQLLERWKHFKKRYVEILIDCFVHPDDPRYAVKDRAGKSYTIKNLVLEELKQFTDELNQK